MQWQKPHALGCPFFNCYRTVQVIFYLMMLKIPWLCPSEEDNRPLHTYHNRVVKAGKRCISYTVSISHIYLVHVPNQQVEKIVLQTTRPCFQSAAIGNTKEPTFKFIWEMKQKYLHGYIWHMGDKVQAKIKYKMNITASLLQDPS